LKRILDDHIKEKNTYAGRFSAKQRIEGPPSPLPMPRNPVQWAVNRYACDINFKASLIVILVL